MERRGKIGRARLQQKTQGKARGGVRKGEGGREGRGAEWGGGMERGQHAEAKLFTNMTAKDGGA
jgi:hypothetical protein